MRLSLDAARCVASWIARGYPSSRLRRSSGLRRASLASLVRTPRAARVNAHRHLDFFSSGCRKPAGPPRSREAATGQSFTVESQTARQRPLKVRAGCSTVGSGGAWDSIGAPRADACASLHFVALALSHRRPGLWTVHCLTVGLSWRCPSSQATPGIVNVITTPARYGRFAPGRGQSQAKPNHQPKRSVKATLPRTTVKEHQ